MEAEIGAMLPQAQERWDHQKLEEARKASRNFRGSVALPTALYWTSHLQNCENLFQKSWEAKFPFRVPSPYSRVTRSPFRAFSCSVTHNSNTVHLANNNHIWRMELNCLCYSSPACRDPDGSGGLWAWTSATPDAAAASPRGPQGSEYCL